MNLLVDTCTLLWWWSDPDKLSPRAVALLRDPANEVRVSAVSAWEVSTKYRIGKFPGAGVVVAEWNERLAADGFKPLDISCSHTLRAGSLPGDHRDPFDRMIAAQSLLEKLPVLSPDSAISALGAERVW
jgi:PIN domain nuclease of toxin-antitoxin system